MVAVMAGVSQQRSASQARLGPVARQVLVVAWTAFADLPLAESLLQGHWAGPEKAGWQGAPVLLLLRLLLPLLVFLVLTTAVAVVRGEGELYRPLLLGLLLRE